MSPRRVKCWKRLNLFLGAGMLFGTGTCVSTVIDTTTAGIGTVGSAGVGATRQTVSLLNGGVKLLVDLVRSLPVVP